VISFSVNSDQFITDQFILNLMALCGRWIAYYKRCGRWIAYYKLCAVL